jgi:hypothetical protein
MTAVLVVSGVLALFGLWARRAEAYAEVHYRPLPGLSRLYSAAPEVYWDCPWRVRHGETLPVALVVKDAHRFPLHIEELSVTIECAGDTHTLVVGSDIPWDVRLPTLVRDRHWFTVLEVALPDGVVGPTHVAPLLRGRIGRKPVTVGVSGPRAFASHPLDVYVAECDLPAEAGWTYAETHTHSWHTDDPIEFGAPPAVIARMARAIGVRWVFVTDHSFDLQLEPGKWFRRDAEERRWRRLESEIKEANAAEERVTLFRGEEVSAGTAANRNVHLLVYGVPLLIPGDGDGPKALRWWDNRPDLRVADVLDIVEQHGGLAFAAHPMVACSALERTLLRRGRWTLDDLSQPLDGWELWNTDAVEPFARARERWVRLLLEGFQFPVVAGSDAHGDFNRTRAIRLPMCSVEEPFREAFGRPRTALYTPDGQADEVLRGLRSGRCVMTNGPFASLSVTADGRETQMGGVLYARDVVVHIHACSTPEFGRLTRVVLCVGRIGGSERRLVLGEDVGYQWAVSGRLTLPEPSYVRVEAEAERDGTGTCAFTNPVWLNYEGERRKWRRLS